MSKERATRCASECWLADETFVNVNILSRSTVGSDGTAAIRYSTVGVVNESEQDLEAVRGPALSVTAERLFFESKTANLIATITRLSSLYLPPSLQKSELFWRKKRSSSPFDVFFSRLYRGWAGG